MKTRICLLLVLAIALSSCDNVVKQKDNYPEIPNFPKFKDDVFTAKRLTKISLELNQEAENLKNKYYFRYLVKDYSVYFITFYTNSDHPAYPNGGEDYTVDLLVIEGNKTEHNRWVDKDFSFNFDLDDRKNLTIGKRKYEAKNNYSKFKSIAEANVQDVDTLFKPWIQGAFATKTDADLEAFDEVTIGSSPGVGGAENAPVVVLEYGPVPLTYYRLNDKGKKGLTKIDFRKEKYPLMIRTKNNIFYVTYQVDYPSTTKQIRTFTFNRID